MKHICWACNYIFEARKFLLICISKKIANFDSEFSMTSG